MTGKRTFYIDMNIDEKIGTMIYKIYDTFNKFFFTDIL